MAEERLHLGGPGAVYHASSMTQHLVRYHAVRALCQGRRILDAACGEGYGSRLMADWGAQEVVGIDCDALAIEIAVRCFSAPNLRFLRGDLAKLDQVISADDLFDIIVSFETMEHMAQDEDFLRGLQRHLAPGGMILVSCPNDHVEPGENPYHIRGYTLEEFQALTTGILGPATQWLLGTPAQGYLLHTPEDDFIINSASTVAVEELVLSSRQAGFMTLIPSQPDIAPSARTCGFYLGCWGGSIDPHAVIAAMSYPAFCGPWWQAQAFRRQAEEAAASIGRMQRQLDEKTTHALALEARLQEQGWQLDALRRQSQVYLKNHHSAGAEGKVLQSSPDVLPLFMAALPARLRSDGMLRRACAGGMRWTDALFRWKPSLAEGLMIRRLNRIGPQRAEKMNTLALAMAALPAKIRSVEKMAEVADSPRSWIGIALRHPTKITYWTAARRIQRFARQQERPR